MDTAQDNTNAYTAGFTDGWKSLPGKGEPPPVLGFINPQFLNGKPHYEAGYERGRKAAMESQRA